jgi:hypothetical protein
LCAVPVTPGINIKAADNPAAAFCFGAATFICAERKKRRGIMYNQHYSDLFVLSNIQHFVERDSGGSTMYNSEIHYLVYREQQKDRLREIEQQHLLQIAGLHRGVAPKAYRQAVNWLGMQMVKLGSRLQRYGSTTQEILTQDVKNHGLKYS